MRLWLDDVRPVPEGYDLWVKTAPEAIALIKEGKITFISFDHDLGPESAGTGYDVACFIEKEACLGRLLKPISFQVHSANTVGTPKIMAAMVAAQSFWSGK